MRSVLPVAAAAVLALTAVPLAAADPKPESETQKVVIHLSHFTDDLHRCFMALKVGSLMQEHGAEVTIFLDLEGVRLAQRREELAFTWGKDSPSLAELYDQFVAGGGRLVLCPHCAKSAHLGDGGLKRNAEIASMPTLGKLLMDADKVLDY